MRALNIKNIKQSSFTDEQKKSLRKLIKEMPKGIWNAGREFDDFLAKVNEAIGGSGIEFVRSGNTWGGYFLDSILLYVNMGDTYSETILFNTEKRKFYIGTWGDFVESYQDKYQII